MTLVCLKRIMSRPGRSSTLYDSLGGAGLSASRAILRGKQTPKGRWGQAVLACPFSLLIQSSPRTLPGSGLDASSFVGIKDKASCVNLRFSFNHNLPLPLPLCPEKETAQAGERIWGKPWARWLRWPGYFLALCVSPQPWRWDLCSQLWGGLGAGRTAHWASGRRSGLGSLPPWKWELSLHFGADNGINEMGWACNCSMNEAMIVLEPDFQDHIRNREQTCRFQEQSLWALCPSK